MQVIKSPKQIQKVLESLRRKGKTVGFVPTMGALHEGHLSLVRAARKENKTVVVSIFVNPTQFGPKEDFSKYPRPLANDEKLLKKAKTDFLFLPSVQDMYPAGTSIYVGVDPKLSNILCGKFRPGHFQGVATVVAKLFNIVRPDRAYFGAKDYQQTVVVGCLIKDLDMNIQLRVLPTTRETDGLAMSSRNRYLSDKDRQRARMISQTLFWMGRRVRSGERNLSKLKQEAIRRLKPFTDRIQYLEIVDPENLESLRKVQSRMVALVACFVGKTRLIDNVIMSAH